MIAFYLILIIVIGVIIHQVLFIPTIVDEDCDNKQNEALNFLKSKTPICQGPHRRIIGDVHGYHLIRCGKDWSIRNGEDIILFAPEVKQSLVHRWKQRKLERMADRYCERWRQDALNNNETQSKADYFNPKCNPPRRQI